MAAGKHTSVHNLNGPQGLQHLKAMKGWLAAWGAALSLAACGGGGGGEAPPPTTPPNVTPAAGGTVTSSDAKLSLTVPANSASTSATIAFTPSAPDAATAADPSYVPNSSYTYSGPEIAFSTPAELVLESPAAVAAAGSAGAFAADAKQALTLRKLAVASPEGPEPEKMCNTAYAAARSLAPHNTWAKGNTCPAGCTQGATLTMNGSEIFLVGATQITHCFPPVDLVLVTPPQTCPPGTTDVTSQIPFALTNQHACLPQSTQAPPQIQVGSSQLLPLCRTVQGSFVCGLSGLAGTAGIAKINLFLDTKAPKAGIATTVAPFLRSISAPGDTTDTIEVTIAEGSTVNVPVIYNGNDDVGLRNVEVREITGINVLAGTATSTVLGQADAAGNLPAGTTVFPIGGGAQALLVPYASSGPSIRYLYARSVDRAGNIAVSGILKLVRASPAAPVISGFTANPTQVTAPGATTTLSWVIAGATTANIDQGVGTVNASSGSATVTVQANTTFTLTATGAGGTVTRTAVVNVAPDTLAPSVILSASSQNIVTPGATTLTAAASDNIGVTRVDFYDGATLLGSRTAAPYTWDINYTSADAGSHSYTARAFDAAANGGSSSALTVVVSLPSSADRFVNPASGSDAATGLSAATAYKTLTKAFTTVGSGGTVWLASGTYTAANEGLNTGVATVLTVPAGRTVRALSDGQAVLNFGLGFAASGGAIGLSFDGLGVSAGMTGIDASAGTVSLSKLSFTNLGNANTGGGGFGAQAALRVHGSAVVTLDAGPGNPLVLGAGVQVGALVFDAGQLTLNGGRLQPTGACGGGCVAQLKVGGTAQLTLDGTVIAIETSGDPLPQPMGLLSGGGALTIRNASISQSGNTTARDLVLANDTATFTLANSTVTSTFHNIAGFQSGTPTANFQNVNVSGSVGRVAGATFSQAGPSPTINVTGGTYSNITGVNGFNATLFEATTGAAGTVNITGATFTNNQNVVDLSGGGTRSLRVRGSTFTGNSACGAACFTFLLAGDAASVFDLGTAADPGANTIQALTGGRGVAVNTNAAVTVNAVGNTWKANVQGANNAGLYVLGTAPCTANSCSVSTGGGANYTVTTGALRLAGN